MNGQFRKEFAYGAQIPSGIAKVLVSRVSVLALVALWLAVSTVMNGQSRKEFAYGLQITSGIAEALVCHG